MTQGQRAVASCWVYMKGSFSINESLTKGLMKRLGLLKEPNDDSLYWSLVNWYNDLYIYWVIYALCTEYIHAHVSVGHGVEL